MKIFSKLLPLIILASFSIRSVEATPTGDTYFATGSELVDSYSNVPVLFDALPYDINTLLDLTRINERYQPYTGIAGGVPVVFAGGYPGNVMSWGKNGQVIEFKINSTDGLFLSLTPTYKISLELTDIDLNHSGPALNLKPTGIYFDFNSGSQDLTYNLSTSLYGRPIAVGPHPLDAAKKVVYVTAEGAELDAFQFASVSSNKLRVFFDSFTHFEGRTAREMMLGLGFNFDVTQPPIVNEFRIGVLLTSEPLAGDFNNDGVVDGSDFLAWQRGFGIPSGAQPSDGDADSDGDVDGRDLQTWKDNYGSGSTSNASNVESITAPIDEQNFLNEITQPEIVVSDGAPKGKNKKQKKPNKKKKKKAKKSAKKYKLDNNLEL